MGCSTSSTSSSLCVASLDNAEKLAPQLQEFLVNAEQSDNVQLGLKLSLVSSRLLVREVEEGGAISAWNAANPGREVTEGGEILEVNGESGCASKMVELLRVVGHLHIRYSRGQADKSTGNGHNGHPHGPACNHHRPDGDLVELPFISAADLGEVTCCICMEDVDPSGRVMQLPCNHHFHLECAAEWLSRKGRCPLCQRRVIPSPPRER
mmetsp:Transcript_57365/g.147515  ORF Transcript_57365/g.147515 Transcript_57365/m.147515 type:complete len:209 (-) Transcript_57365:509-1135(-)